MAFRPNVGDELTLNNVTYRIAEHPAAPGIPYGQEGRAGIVYQLLPADRSAGFQPAALKVFRARFRTPALVSQAEKLAAFADLPGLTVCRRTVLTPTRHADLLRREPDLTYAVLMPWIEGPTWVEVMLEKRPLTPQQALDLARAFAQVLVRMEEQGLAHCDLSGPNVLLPMLAGQTADRRPQTACSPSSTVELVDVEGLYAPGLPRPEVLPSGSAGYAHRTAREGLWGPTADRFAGAVLLAEMLGWGDESVRQACYGETYFDPAEMPAQGGANPPRYRTLTAALARHYGQPVADLFERAWMSETLADCPTFGEWLVALPEHPVGQAFSLSTPAAETTAGEQPTSPQESAAVDAIAEIRAFMQAARRMEDKRNLEGALELYRQALELAQADPSLRSLAREIELTVQDVKERAAHDTQVLKPIRVTTSTSPLPAGVPFGDDKGPGVRVDAPLSSGEGKGVRAPSRPAGEERGVRELARRKRRPWAWALGGIIFLLMALGGIWILRQTIRPAISPENAKQAVQLARWSQDRVSNEDALGWSPQGTWLFVPSTMGVRLYSNDDFTNYRLIETGKHPTFSPDEKFIASAVNPPGTIRLTDVQSGDMVKEWRPHDAAITDLWFRGDILFSRDENDVLVANDFTADPPAELLRTQVGDGEIFTLSDGSTLIEVDTDLTQQPPTQRLQICRVSENRCESGTNVDMGLDGLLLGISPDFTENQGSVVIWKNNGEVVAQNASGQEISTLGIYTDTTTLPNVRISPHGKYVVIGNEIRRIQDGQVIATGKTFAQKVGQDIPVDLDLLIFSPDEHYLAVRDVGIPRGFLLNLENREIYLLRLPKASMGTFSSPTFRPDSQEVMFPVVGPGVSIPVFSTVDGSVRGEIDANSGSAVLRMTFTATGDLAVLYPAELQVRSLCDGQILQTIRHNAGLNVALMEDGFYSQNRSPDYDKVEYIFTPYNTRQPSRKMAFQQVSEETGFVEVYSDLDVSRGPLFAFSPDHRYLIREVIHMASPKSISTEVVLYEVDRPDPLRTALPRPGGGYLSELVFAPDSSLLAVGLEKDVILLSIPDMNIVGEQTTENEITGLAFGPDGKTIAITTESAQVLLWNFDTGTLERLDTQTEENRTPTFSADGRLLAIIVPGGIQLWDVSAGRLLRTLEAPDVVSLAFSPDQKFLVAGAKQDVIYLWGVRWTDVLFPNLFSIR